jgi:putative ABC transport system substrate-binding protein
MRRRELMVLFLGGAMTRARALGAQQRATRVYRIGFLRNGPPPESLISGFRRGLRELGYVEGENISIEYGLAGSADQLPG